MCQPLLLPLSHRATPIARLMSNNMKCCAMMNVTHPAPHSTPTILYTRWHPALHPPPPPPPAPLLTTGCSPYCTSPPSRQSHPPTLPRRLQPVLHLPPSPCPHPYIWPPPPTAPLLTSGCSPYCTLHTSTKPICRATSETSALQGSLAQHSWPVDIHSNSFQPSNCSRAYRGQGGGKGVQATASSR